MQSNAASPHEVRSTNFLALGRCLRHRMGCPFQVRKIDGRFMEPNRESMAHQQERNSCHKIGSTRSLPPKRLTIAIATDSVTTAHVLRSWGSRRSPNLTKEVRPLLELCTKNDWTLQVSRIPSCLNVLADKLSRRVPLPGEWSITKRTRDHLFSWTRVPRIDMMATPYNHQVPKFISVFPHPDTIWTDATTTDWGQWSKIYLFPPPAMIQWCLERIAQFQGEVILVSCLPLSSILWKITADRDKKIVSLLEPPGQWVLDQWLTHSSGSPWIAVRFAPRIDLTLWKESGFSSMEVKTIVD